jgi:hypothetical protein
MPNYALLKKSMPNAQSQGGNFDEDKKEPGSRKKKKEPGYLDRVHIPGLFDGKKFHQDHSYQDAVRLVGEPRYYF